MRLSIVLLTAILWFSPTSTWQYLHYQTPSQKALVYHYEDDQLTVSTKDTALPYTLVMEACGPNKLFAIKSLTLFHTKETVTMISGTDWVGPYIVADASQSTDTSPFFTGGWHQIPDTHLPTAYMQSYEVLVNGHPLTHTDGKTSDITIVLTNHIMAYNSLEPVLEEEVTYHIVKNDIRVSVQITALKDCLITRYYGLQVYHYPWDQAIIYQGSLRDYVYPIVDSTYGPNKSEDLVNAVTVTSAHTSLRAWLEPNFGLSDYAYVSEDTPTAFSLSYGKTYFNLINGYPCLLSPGDHLQWSGGYQIGTKED